MNRSRHLAVLRRVVTAAGSPLDVDALLDRTMRSLTTLTGNELASLHLFSPDRRTLRLRADRGLSPRLRRVNLVHLPGEGLIGRVAMSGQPVELKRVTRSAHLLPAARGVVEADGIRAFACVPICVAGRVLGTVSVGRRTAEPFTVEDLRLLEATAGHVGSILGCAPGQPGPSPADTTRRRELLAALVDELRRSHQSMLGWARLLRDHHAADLSVSAHGLTVLERSLTRQTQLLGDLQDLSHILAGTLPCDRRPIDLVATLEAAVADWAPGEEASPVVDLVTELASCPVVGDERRLRQVIATLVSDTVASVGGRPKVVVRLERARDRARIAVGVGVALPVLAAPGRTLRASLCDSAASRGEPESIELAIARHLILLHEGTLVRHDPGDAARHETVVELPALTAAA